MGAARRGSSDVRVESVVRQRQLLGIGLEPTQRHGIVHRTHRVAWVCAVLDLSARALCPGLVNGVV